MSFDEELKMSSDEFAKAKELFILEQMQAYMEPNGKGGMCWTQPVKLRLTEIEDYKQRVRDAIEKVFGPHCTTRIRCMKGNIYSNGLITGEDAILLLTRELGL